MPTRVDALTMYHLVWAVTLLLVRPTAFFLYRFKSFETKGSNTSAVGDLTAPVQSRYKVQCVKELGKRRGFRVFRMYVQYMRHDLFQKVGDSHRYRTHGVPLHIKPRGSFDVANQIIDFTESDRWKKSPMVQEK